MTLFAYKAADAGGNLIEGQIEAADEAAVIRQLQGLGQVPLETVPARAAPGRIRSPATGGGRRARPRDVTVFIRQLSILLSAGQPLERALVTMTGGNEAGTVGRLAQRMLDGVRAGTSLSVAAEALGPVFPRIAINMIRAGESSGTLPVVLARLSELRERGEKIRGTVTSTLLYPALLVLVSLASIFLLLTYVVPQFESVFRDAGAALPTSTAVVVALGRFLQDDGWLLMLAALAGLLGLRHALTVPRMRGALDRMALRLPLVGPLLRLLVTARFCRTLATLVENGVDLPNALQLARDVVPNLAVSAALDTVVTGVRQGRGLADPMAETGLFPAFAVQMLRVGEETGRIDLTAGHIADAYEQQLEDAIKRLVGLLEPTLIIGLGLAVGGIVMSILVAILGLNDLAV
ncbi:type II secretion system F family protein [Inquilinus sp. NPDC058860]|uniref:type II secretion system F family protein n=1 Tax=Inquilinus sp. NPDC058860 TaxID=3346652 RepID=UPI00369ACE30